MDRSILANVDHPTGECEFNPASVPSYKHSSHLRYHVYSIRNSDRMERPASMRTMPLCLKTHTVVSLGQVKLRVADYSSGRSYANATYQLLCPYEDQIRGHLSYIIEKKNCCIKNCWPPDIF